MQGGKNASALDSAKEAVANVGASAWAGKEKTKAVLEEKVAKVRARDPAEKAAADERMQERVREVEAVKQDAMRQNAAGKERATAAAHHPTPPAQRALELEAEQAGGDDLVGGAAQVPPKTTDTAAAALNATETGAAATGGHFAGAPETGAAAPDGAAVNDVPNRQP